METSNDKELESKELEEGELKEFEPTDRSVESSPSFEKGTIGLELGDIIEIIAPPNEEIHENTFLITYVDTQKIKITDTATYKAFQLNINPDGTITDESIQQIILLNRAEQKGYARQNDLTVGTWIDIEFGGEIPTLLSGEISNLDEDMIELITYPDLKTIYIDFAYKGIPDDIPIERITIRKKPASLKSVGSLSMLRDHLDAEGVDTFPDQHETELASVEFTETGESMIRIPEGAKPDDNIREVLQDMYIDANTIIYGEKLEKITQLVEVPENEQRYGIDAQVNDMMDELLSTIPNSQRNRLVLDNIHRLIERFKELRSTFSKFDTNQNAYDTKMLGAFYKPLINHLKTFDTKLKWIVPVVSTRRKIYNIKAALETKDVSITENEGTGLIELETMLTKRTQTSSMTYVDMHNRINEILTPIDIPATEEICLATVPVLENIDSIVDNLEDFYSSVVKVDEIKRRKFVIQRYNLGLTHLKEEITKTGKKTYEPQTMTPNDKLCIRSFLMMPEPVFQFSNIDFPTTTILEKASLHQNYFLLFRLLKQNVDIIPHVIDDLSKEFDYERMEKEDKINFLEGLQEFVLDKDVYVDKKEKYEKFLEAIVPKTRFLIRLVRKYIKDKVSFISVVKQLEPFMVYPSDVSYKQYVEINSLIRERISEIKKRYEQRYADFSLIRNAKYDVNPKMNPILRLLSENKDFSEAFFQAYRFLSKDKIETKMSSQEILARMYETDNVYLYTNVLTAIMLTLMTPNNLMDALAEPQLDDLSENEKIKPKDCSRRYLAKSYPSIKALQEDNNKEDVFYDKEYDDTPYGILKRYEKQKKEMLPELFYEYLVENLVEKHDCPRGSNYAKELATTLINKKKQVMDGDYAILEIKPTLPKDVDPDSLNADEKASVEAEADIRKKTSYYKRIKDVWVTDNEINQDAFLDTNTLFCNISENCFKNSKNAVCEDGDDAMSRMKEANRKAMLQEFDKRYAITAEELEKELERNIEYHFKQLRKMERLKEIQSHKQNNLAYELGKLANSNADLIYSPYLKLRDMILGQDDFAKKQADICRFVEKFCREPMVEQLNENAHWHYCKETNTKLFPMSIHQLAETFISGGDYAHKLDEIAHFVGTLSDDGDSVVDKYSGFFLRKKELSNEEGRDEAGFKITSHDILEKELGAVVMEALGKRVAPVFESETMEAIYNIMSAICKNIDVPMDSIEEFIKRTSNIIIEKEVFTEEMYQKKSDYQLKKTGKPFKTTYKDYKNETMITIIAGVLLVAVQTAIPSFKIKRTFPNCVRSFSGFPMGGIEDITGIQYLACVLSKMKLSQDPWKSISKYKSETLVTRIKTLLENNIANRPDVEELYVKKREYMLLNPELVAPEEHSIQKWKQFLPPIVPFEVVKKLHNVSSEFVTDFENLMHRGSEHQNESIMVLKSKMIYYGYGIIESINDIVKTKDQILKTAAKIPFLENACCNDRIDATNPIVYFRDEDKNIDICIRGAGMLEKILNRVRNLSTPYFLYHLPKTGIQYPVVQLGHFEENTYLTVIRYCNFDRELPIPEDYKIFCNEKPEGYDASWSLEEKMEFLKKNGKRYTVDDLQQLMKIVNQKNIVSVDTKRPFSQVDVLRDILEKLDMMNSTIIAEPLRNLIHKVLEQFNPLVMPDTPTKEVNDVMDYLILNNRDLYTKIMRFFDDYGANMADSKYRALHEFLSHVERWKLDKPMSAKEYVDEGLYTVTQYVTNAIQMFSKVYPNMLMSDQDFYKQVPKHWDLSKEHQQDITSFLDKYYEELEEFKQDEVLVRLFKEVSDRLLDLNTFVNSIPVHTEVVREFPGDDGKPIIKTFYSMFNKKTTLELYKYCFYSTIFEYILSCNDVELIREDVQKHKRTMRKKKSQQYDQAAQLQGDLSDYDDDMGDADAMLTEYEIQLQNPEELKARVCKLLFAFLDIEEKNKTSVDFSYDEIMKRVGRSKEKEKQGIIKKLRKMSIEERGVEDMLKNYRLEHWNVGQQKGLFQYDKETYKRERDELLAGLEDEVRGQGIFDNTNEERLDIYELAKQDAANVEAEDAGVGRDDYDFTDMGEGFMDGDYYGDEQDDDFRED
jgi:hypothetical protein